MKAILWISLFLLVCTPLAAGPRVKIEADSQVFWMDTKEITRGEYFLFEQEVLFKGVKGSQSKLKAPAEKDAHKARSNVNWFEAAQYCRWQEGRLPTAEEWEKAAGLGQRKYPWGDQPIDGTRANFCDVNCVTPWANRLENDHAARLSEVGQYPAGATPEGLLDMAGNLWEWTATRFDNGQVLELRDKDQSRDEAQAVMVIKGGSYGSRLNQLENQHRSKSFAPFRSSHVGFRCLYNQPAPAQN